MTPPEAPRRRYPPTLFHFWVGESPPTLLHFWCPPRSPPTIPPRPPPQTPPVPNIPLPDPYQNSLGGGTSPPRNETGWGGTSSRGTSGGSFNTIFKIPESESDSESAIFCARRSALLPGKSAGGIPLGGSRLGARATPRQGSSQGRGGPVNHRTVRIP